MEVLRGSARWLGMREAIRHHIPQPILVWRRRRHQRRITRSWGWDVESRQYITEHGLAVQAGPFAGMRLPEGVVTWEQCAVISTLRGTYEREIHPFLTGEPGLFVDIGAAEGTYLVGMALRGWRSVGFEIDPVRRRRARELAEANGVSIETRGAFKPDLDLDRALVLVDIEGAEAGLIPQYAASLRTARVIVEFHYGSEASVIPALEPTHSVTRVRFEGRPPEEAELRADDQLWGVFDPRA